MGSVEIGIGALWFVSAAFIAAGLVMLGPTRDDYRRASFFFILAGLAFVVSAVLWGVTTNTEFIQRALVVGMIGAISAIGVNEGLRLVASRQIIGSEAGAPNHPAGEQPTGTKSAAAAAEQTMTIEKKIDNRGGIYNEGNNSGTQTVINQAPEPDLKMISQTSAPNPDGSFTSSVMVEVIAPYTPGNLTIEAHAPGLQSLEVRPQSAGLYVEGHSGRRQDMAFTNIPGPHGKYLVLVITKQQVDVRIDWSFK